MTTFAFIGFGEAGGILAAGLAKAGAAVRATYDILIENPATAARHRAKAEAQGIIAAPSAAQAVAGADVVISAVVADQTVVAAANVAPHLTPGQIYMDINSTSPKRKREAAAAIEAGGAAFVEAAVMNVVPGPGIKVPMLLAGREAPALVDLLRPYGMEVRAIGERIGDASAVKMVRSVFVKGFNCILLECMVAASRYKVEDRVLDSLDGSYPEFDWRAVADESLPRLIRHGKRQSSEMHAVAETLQDIDMDPFMALGSAKRLGWIADFGLLDKLDELPKTYREFLDLVDREDGWKATG